LNKVHGLTMRTICRVLKELCGLRITAGGLSRALVRIGGRAQGVYDKLIEGIRASPAVFANETSWWVGGPQWWLWLFTTVSRTVCDRRWFPRAVLFVGYEAIVAWHDTVPFR